MYFCVRGWVVGLSVGCGVWCVIWDEMRQKCEFVWVGWVLSGMWVFVCDVGWEDT